MLDSQDKSKYNNSYKKKFKPQKSRLGKRKRKRFFC